MPLPPYILSSKEDRSQICATLARIAGSGVANAKKEKKKKMLHVLNEMHSAFMVVPLIGLKIAPPPPCIFLSII